MAIRLMAPTVWTLHQLYRAMAWLGEELADQSGATRARRRIKDLTEEALFRRRRSLFSDLSVVLFDTTSLMFYGAGGDSLGQRGKSKDHRPDLKLVVVGVVLDEAGRPICSETWPGNAADVKALLPVVRRLRERFGMSRMCVVADRGMISAETINELEAHGVKYILGARERNSAEVRRVVLADEKPMIPLVIPRARGAETALEVKEVVVGDWGLGCHPRRYVVCFNSEEARRDAATREAILDSPRTKLQQGDKGLAGNAGYRRFLATPNDGHFEIDPARVTEDARFDGIYVLRTNSKLPVLSVALAYRHLLKVEAIFRTAKSILETRPIYHQSDAAIAGHLFCSFLALLLRKELDERLSAARVTVEWDDVVRDLDRVEQITIEQNAKCFHCDQTHQVALAACSKPSGWPYRRWSANCRRPLRRRPLSPQSRRHAAGARGVVPRVPEFPGFRFEIYRPECHYPSPFTQEEHQVLKNRRRI
jgi:Transposase DDE domain